MWKRASPRKCSLKLGLKISFLTSPGAGARFLHVERKGALGLLWQGDFAHRRDADESDSHPD